MKVCNCFYNMNIFITLDMHVPVTVGYACLNPYLLQGTQSQLLLVQATASRGQQPRLQLVQAFLRL